MDKITRAKQEIFANQAGSRQITAFGTAKSEAPNFTTDLAQIQNTNYLYGWASALLPDKAPYEEDMNALFYTITRQLAYLFQTGIPEWDAETEYYTNSFCQVSGVWYQSLVDNNIGNNPVNDTTNWKKSNDNSLASYEIGKPEMTLEDSLLPNEIWLEGGKLLKTQSPVLAEKWGNRYAPSSATDTESYLYLPDFRNRAIYGANGAGDYGYVEAELPNLKGWFQVGAEFSSADNVLFTRENAGLRNTESSYTGSKFTFDASKYNPIYKDGGTVKTPGIKARFKTRYY